MNHFCLKPMSKKILTSNHFFRSWIYLKESSSKVLFAMQYIYMWKMSYKQISWTHSTIAYVVVFSPFATRFCIFLACVRWVQSSKQTRKNTKSHNLLLLCSCHCDRNACIRITSELSLLNISIAFAEHRINGTHGSDPDSLWIARTQKQSENTWTEKKNCVYLFD